MSQVSGYSKESPHSERRQQEQQRPPNVGADVAIAHRGQGCRDHRVRHVAALVKVVRDDHKVGRSLKLVNRAAGAARCRFMCKQARYI